MPKLVGVPTIVRDLLVNPFYLSHHADVGSMTLEVIEMQESRLAVEERELKMIASLTQAVEPNLSEVKLVQVLFSHR
jgi:hypothetical protein